MEIFPGISMDPGVRFGKPCLLIVGTRIDVATVVGALAGNESYEEVEKALISPGSKFWLRFVTRHTSPLTITLQSRKCLENAPR